MNKGHMLGFGKIDNPNPDNNPVGQREGAER